MRGEPIHRPARPITRVPTISAIPGSQTAGRGRHCLLLIEVRDAVDFGHLPRSTASEG